MLVVAAAVLLVILGVGLGMLAVQMGATDADARRVNPGLFRALSGGELVGKPSNDNAAATLTTRAQRTLMRERMGVHHRSLFVALDLEPQEAPPGVTFTKLVPFRIDRELRRVYYTPGPMARRQVLTACASEVLRLCAEQWTLADAEAMADEIQEEAREAQRVPMVALYATK